MTTPQSAPAEPVPEPLVLEEGEPTPTSESEPSLPTEVLTQIERTVGSAFPEVPELRREQVVHQLASIYESFSGPMPHPRHLEAYEKTCPGAADRLLALVEREQTTQHEVTRANISLAMSLHRDESRYKLIGLICGLCCFLALIAASLAAGYFISPWLGGLFIGATAVGVIWKFIDGTTGKDRE